MDLVTSEHKKLTDAIDKDAQYITLENTINAALQNVDGYIEAQKPLILKLTNVNPGENDEEIRQQLEDSTADLKAVATASKKILNNYRVAPVSGQGGNAEQVLTGLVRI